MKAHIETSEKKCILPVCGGTDVMNGRYFAATVEAVRQQFDQVHVVMADQLDAHNICPSPQYWDESLDVSIAMGDRWIRKHSHLLPSHWTIHRWADVKADPDFKWKYNRSRWLYQHDAKVGQWIDRVCGEYAALSVQRKSKSHTVSFEAEKQRSINYMLEEIAGTSVYYKWFKCPAVYPGQYFEGEKMFGEEMLVPDHIPVFFGEQRLTA